MSKSLDIELIVNQLRDQYGPEVVVDEKAMRDALATEAERYQGLGIKALSVVGGFLASSFFIGFLVTILSQWSMALLIFGALAILTTVLVDKISTSTVIDTMIISTYLSANLMIGMALHQLTKNDITIASILLVISMMVPFLTKSYMLNLLSVLMIHGCVFSLLYINDGKILVHLFPLLPMASYCFVSFLEPKLLTNRVALNLRFSAWRTGILFSLIAALIYSTSMLFNGPAYLTWVRLVSLPIWGSLLIIFVSFYTSHKTGLVAGILLLIYAIIQYYYNLDYTLLTKSYIMMLTGVLFLLAWFLFKKKVKQEHE